MADQQHQVGYIYQAFNAFHVRYYATENREANCAQGQAHLTVMRSRAGLVRARTALVNMARGVTKPYGEGLRGCKSFTATSLRLVAQLYLAQTGVLALRTPAAVAVDRPRSPSLSSHRPVSGARTLLVPNLHPAPLPTAMHRNLDFVTADQQLTSAFPLPSVRLLGHTSTPWRG